MRIATELHMGNVDLHR